MGHWPGRAAAGKEECMAGVVIHTGKLFEYCHGRGGISFNIQLRGKLYIENRLVIERAV